MRCDLRPFLAHREACAAAAADAGIGDRLNDFVRAHLKERLGHGGVAAHGEIVLQRLRVDLVAVLEHAARLLLVEGNVVMRPADLTALSIAQTVDEFAALERALHDLVDVFLAHTDVDPVFRLDAQHGAEFAQTVTAGLAHADGLTLVLAVQLNLAGDAHGVELALQRFVDLQSAAGETSGAGADQHAAGFGGQRRLILRLRGLERRGRFNSIHHNFSPPLSTLPPDPSPCRGSWRHGQHRSPSQRGSARTRRGRRQSQWRSARRPWSTSSRSDRWPHRAR